jgi:hypothetical protein
MSGKIKSTMSGEDILPIVDRTQLTDDQKTLLDEILQELQLSSGKPTSSSIENLKIKFNMTNIPVMRYEDSLWYQMTKDERLGPSIQGFRQIKDKNGEDFRIPHVAFSADLDYLDAMLSRILIKMQNLVPVEKSSE